MPRLIDHDAQRRRIAVATWQVLQNGGPESLNLRNIARQANCTTGTLSHYFRNRGELVAFSYDLVVSDLIDQLLQSAPKLEPGLARFRGMLELLVPQGSGVGMDCVVTVSSWSFAINDPELALRHHASYGRLRSLAAVYAREAIEAGQLAAMAVPEDVSDIMIAFADGMCVAMLIETANFPPDRCVRLVDQFMAGLTTMHPPP